MKDILEILKDCMHDYDTDEQSSVKGRSVYHLAFDEIKRLRSELEAHRSRRCDNCKHLDTKHEDCSLHKHVSFECVIKKLTCAAWAKREVT